MRDHWWWRPGWRTGRSFYTWHITFADQPGAHDLAAGYSPALAGLPVIDPVPSRWLHLTLQGIGFTDEVTGADVDRIVSAARARCARLTPCTVTIGPARVDPETIQLPVRPPAPLAALRLAVRGAIGDVWGRDHVPEAASGFRPHVSLGFQTTSASRRCWAGHVTSTPSARPD
ncbi:2'-5' RNA ligase family protein [Actinophytocola sediminis]